jgi:hypothetical protein
MTDFPLSEILREAERLINAGVDVYQKFTCQNCGERLAMEEPNVFYKSGRCDKCGHITNIEKTGCNYMFVWTGKETNAKNGT